MNERPVIQDVTCDDIPAVLDFVLVARGELFPKLSAAGMPDDLARFEAVYVHGDGQFLIARVDGRIVAAIGYVPYNGRFSQLNYQGLKTVEVVRLFVAPASRRFGLAGELYGALEAKARGEGWRWFTCILIRFLLGRLIFGF